jgi:hypothetical protein
MENDIKLVCRNCFDVFIANLGGFSKLVNEDEFERLKKHNGEPAANWLRSNEQKRINQSTLYFLSYEDLSDMEFQKIKRNQEKYFFIINEGAAICL